MAIIMLFMEEIVYVVDNWNGRRLILALHGPCITLQDIDIHVYFVLLVHD